MELRVLHPPAHGTLHLNTYQSSNTQNMKQMEKRDTETDNHTFSETMKRYNLYYLFLIERFHLLYPVSALYFLLNLIT